MPAAVPADVNSRSPPTYSTFGSSSTSGKRSRNASEYVQCVVALRPASSPVAASTKAPEQNVRDPCSTTMRRAQRSKHRIIGHRVAERLPAHSG